jgi:hypothetical protein
MATIESFVASSLYVLGLSTGLHQPVYELFELKDYLEVTPVWLLPTTVYLLFAGFVSLFLPPIITMDTRDTRTRRGEPISLLIVVFLPLLLLLVLYLVRGCSKQRLDLRPRQFARCRLLGLTMAFLILYQKRLVGLEPEQKWLRFVLMTNIIA